MGFNLEKNIDLKKVIAKFTETHHKALEDTGKLMASRMDELAPRAPIRTSYLRKSFLVYRGEKNIFTGEKDSKFKEFGKIPGTTHPNVKVPTNYISDENSLVFVYNTKYAKNVHNSPYRYNSEDRDPLIGTEFLATHFLNYPIFRRAYEDFFTKRAKSK